MQSEKQGSYACVQCGEECPNLYRQYSEELIEVSKCSSCAKIADHYIEYDNIILFLDIILLRIQAFRHLLFNAGFRQKWAFRLLAFTCLCEAYNHWALEHRGQQAITAAVEISYYVKLVTALAGIVAQTVLTLILLFICKQCNKSVKTNLRTTVEGIILCNYSILYLMVIHIWIPEFASHAYYLLKLYKAATCVQALKALTGGNPVVLAVISLITCAADLWLNIPDPGHHMEMVNSLLLYKV